MKIGFRDATAHPYFSLNFDLRKGEVEITARFTAALMGLHNNWSTYHVGQCSVSLVRIKPCAKWEISLLGDFGDYTIPLHICMY